MRTPVGELAERIGGHVGEAQLNLSVLTRFVVRALERDATEDEKRQIEHLLVYLAANVSHLEELGCDVLELEERIERSDRAVAERAKGSAIIRSMLDGSESTS